MRCCHWFRKAAQSHNTNRLRCANKRLIWSINLHLFCSVRYNFKYDVFCLLFWIFHQWENKFETKHFNYVLFFLNVCKLSPVHVILWCLRFFIFFARKQCQIKMFHLKRDCFLRSLFLQSCERAVSVRTGSLLAFSFAPRAQYEPEQQRVQWCSLLVLRSPTVRRQEGALPPNRCQHELEMTPTVAQISSWSLEGRRTENTTHICNEFKHLRAAILTAQQISYSLFI